MDILVDLYSISNLSDSQEIFFYDYRVGELSFDFRGKTKYTTYVFTHMLQV